MTAAVGQTIFDRSRLQLTRSRLTAKNSHVKVRCVIHFLLLSLSYLFLKRAPCFIHCEGKAANGGGVLMTIMIPSCNAHAYMKFSKKNFAPYARNAMVKNIKTINKYNVGMKSLDRAIIVSDTLKTETSPSFIF